MGENVLGGTVENSGRKRIIGSICAGVDSRSKEVCEPFVVAVVHASELATDKSMVPMNIVNAQVWYRLVYGASERVWLKRSWRASKEKQCV